MKLGLTYVVLRTHARVADLLDKDQMGELAEAVDVDDFLIKLEKSPYGMVEVKRDDKLALNLEKVFIQKFIERIESIVNIIPTKMGDFLKAYFNLRFEVLNLKRILRGKFTNSTDEQIRESLIPISPYKVDSYDLLLESDSLEDAVAMLKGTQYDSLVEKLELYREYDALWPLELALNYI